jgi:cytidyltransferase-like protein
MKYKHATVGGTFDHLHAGHVALLYCAFDTAETVSIAITSDEFAAKKKYKESMQPFEARKKELVDFLTAKDLIDRVKLIEIHDPFAFAPTDASLDSIIVTEETMENAQRINKLRAESGLPPLAVITVPFHKGYDGDVISSTLIREGLLDRNGFNFLKVFTGKEKIEVPEHMKERLRVPLGEVVIDTKELLSKIKHLKSKRLISVGDVVTTSLREAGVTPTVAVIDYRTRRESLPTNTSKQGLVNEAGTIEPKTVEKLAEAIRSGKNQEIVISGEEDLLALPAILLAPLGSIVVYGQYGLGVVLVHVTEEFKESMRTLMLEIIEPTIGKK